jgi:glutathione S-transferase
MMTIHNFARGARGQRAMWLCEEMGLPYAVRNHSFPVAADYRALNPLGTIPFLQDDSGVAMNESIAIMLYIAERYGPTPLLPAHDAALLAKCLQLTLFGETELGMNLNPVLAARFMAVKRTSAIGRYWDSNSGSNARSSTQKPWCTADPTISSETI